MASKLKSKRGFAESLTTGFLSARQIARIRNDTEEKVFAPETNALINRTIDELLVIQQSTGRLVLRAGQMRVLAIRYCAIVRRAAGDFTERLAKAGSSTGHGLGNRDCRGITDQFAIFISGKADAHEASLFLMREIWQRFAIRNEKYACRVLRESIALLAHPRPQTTKEDGLRERSLRQRALERFARGDDRAVRKSRPLFLKGFDLQSEAKQKLEAAVDLYGARKKPTRRRRGASDVARSNREKKIREIISLECKGLQYCREMDSRKIPGKLEWRNNKEWPGTYEAAYKQDKKWQKRIQQEKWRIGAR